MKGLLQQFLAEGRDLIEQVDAGLLGLERDPEDRTLLDQIFRAAHTIKGSSGLFDLPQLTRLTHAAEDLLDAVRASRLELDTEMADDLLAAFDLIGHWLDVIEETGGLPSDAATAGAALSARLRSPLGDDRPAARVPSPREGTAAELASDRPSEPAPGWVLAGLGIDRVEQVRNWLEHARTTCRILRFEPDEQCFFVGADPLHLVAQIPAIEALAVEPREPWPALEDFDEYRCLLAFTVVTRATVREVEHLYRYVPDELSLTEVDAAALTSLLATATARSTEAPTEASTEAADAARTEAARTEAARTEAARGVLAAQLEVLRANLPAEQASARISSVGVVTRGALSMLGATGERLATLAEVLAEAVRDGTPETLATLIESELARTAQPAGSAVDDPAAAPPALVRSSGGERTAAAGPERRTGEDRRATAHRVLKVDQVTVDRLLELVGELVVAKNGLPFLATAAEETWNARALGRQIKEQYGVVSRISEELQVAVMDVRMLPMSVVFARFPRMVRDLARSLGKQVTLELEGEDTAADKDVIELLGDPLLHLIRNSLDHGIESPAERVAAGKPAGATVRLRACQEPDAVVIDIIDDGRGIDPAAIRLKAYERGMITERQLDALTDQEAVNLVFLPGFSTAAQVSDVSGRGVGMDAVRAAVEAAGGSVRFSSTLGEGSQVRLRVPLSMAVSRVMIVTVAGQRFGVPVDLVIETVRVPRERVGRVEHHDVIVLRNAVVPLVDLAGTLQMLQNPADRDLDADQDLVSVLVTRPDGADVGLMVDAFHEGAEVIVKPMGGIMAGSHHFCGTALMGDGSVLLVLDVKEVLADAAATR